MRRYHPFAIRHHPLDRGVVRRNEGVPQPIINEGLRRWCARSTIRATPPAARTGLNLRNSALPVSSRLNLLPHQSRL